MLKVIRSLNQLDVAQLQQLYDASSYSAFYDSLIGFFEEPRAYICIWQVNEHYVSALRIEPFQDGWLVAGLETAAMHRRKGYAKALLTAVINQLPPDAKLYSHIEIRNEPSIAVHKACGFAMVLDYAKLLDGSVSTNFHTFIKTAPMQ